MPRNANTYFRAISPTNAADRMTTSKTMVVDKSGCFNIINKGAAASSIETSIKRKSFILSLNFIINCAKNRINIIFADSDNIFNSNDIKNFVNFSRENNLEGALLTINSNNVNYSYAKCDENDFLIETKEKEVISNHAITGVYYFKSLNNFRDSVIDLVVESDLSKGEFYMSNVFNHLKKFSNKIKVFDIKHFDCVGTPEQLEKYIKERCFAKV